MIRNDLARALAPAMTTLLLLAAGHAGAASYTQTNGTVVDPITFIGGIPHNYAGPSLGPGVSMPTELLSLGSAFLGSADLSNSQIRRTLFTKADMRFADLSGAEASGAYFKETYLRDAIFDGANLSVDPILYPVTLMSGMSADGASFVGANMEGVSLDDEARAVGGDFHLAILTSAKMRSGNWLAADFSSAQLAGADLRFANLRGTNLSGATVQDTDLRGASLLNANGLASTIGAALFDGATDFSGTGFDPVAAGWTDAGPVPNLSLAFSILDSLVGDPRYVKLDDFGVSSTGTWIVGTSNRDLAGSVGPAIATRWSIYGDRLDLGDLPGAATQSFALDVSDDGGLVVGYSYSNVPPINGLTVEPFIWDSENGMRSIWTAIGQPRYPGYAVAISGDGSVIVGRAFRVEDEPIEAFVWNQSGVVTWLGTLDPPSDVGTQATDVSQDGSVVVGRGGDFQNSQAFTWDAVNGMQPVPGMTLLLYGPSVSADGTTVTGGNFIWDDVNGTRDLGVLDEWTTNCTARDISGNGDTVVGYCNGTFGTEGFVWDEQNAMRKQKTILLDEGVNMTGIDVSIARAISADGNTFVSRVGTPDGLRGAFSYLPEPASATQLGLGGLALAVLRRRRSRGR